MNANICTCDRCSKTFESGFGNDYFIHVEVPMKVAKSCSYNLYPKCTKELAETVTELIEVEINNA